MATSFLKDKILIRRFTTKAKPILTEGTHHRWQQIYRNEKMLIMEYRCKDCGLVKKINVWNCNNESEHFQLLNYPLIVCK